MNILVKEDKSYMSNADFLAIDNGVAKLGIHSIKINRYLTEEQKQENRRFADILTSEQWSNHCEQKREDIANKIEIIIDKLAKEFVIYQYKDKSISYLNDDWDLFFWCNSGDMSHIRLNPNKKRSLEQQLTDIQKALDVLNSLESEGLQVIIQYTAIYDEEKLNTIVLNYCKSVQNKFIEYNGLTGKIKEIGTDCDGKVKYGFFSKGSRKRYYNIAESFVVESVFA